MIVGVGGDMPISMSDKTYANTNSVSTKIENGKDNQFGFLKIDDSDFPADLTSSDSITFWAYLESSNSEIFNDMKFRFESVTDRKQIKDYFYLPANTWTQITITGADLQQYLSIGDGLVLFSYIQNLSAGKRAFNLYIDDFQIVRGTSK